MFALAGVGFVLATLIYGRQLEEELFGEAVLVIALCLSSVQAAPAAINALVIRYDLTTGLPVLRATAALGVVFAAVACLAAHLIYGMSPMILLVIAVTIVLGAMAQGAVSGLQRMQDFSRSTLVSQSANAGLLLAAFAMLGGVGLTSWFPAALAAGALAVTGVLAWRRVLSAPQTGAPLEARLWKRGVNFGGLAVTAELMAQIERFLIPILLTYHELAHFAVVAAIALTPFRVLEMGAISTLAPRLRSAKGWAKRRQLLVFDLVLLAGLTTFAGLVILMIGPWICSFFLPALEFPTPVLIAVMVSGYGRVLAALAKGIASAFGTASELTRVHCIGWMGVAASVAGGFLFSDDGLTGVIYGIAIGWFFKAAAILALSVNHLRRD